jgi:asparagine synthase (glutamine-hydrolysing)
MSNEDGSLWLSFNGEIYNHAEIRREIEATGRHRWKTDHSDSEVILHAFEEWGIRCIERFRGMFAFAIWDSKARDLWLVRDRLGVKPLYYSINRGRFSFASEIKALLTDPEQKRSINPSALYHYLSFLATPAPQTLFDGIYKLPAGHWLRVRESGSIEERCYWDVWDHASGLTQSSEGELCERLVGALRESVSLRKVSDVPVGVFLSGGVDSSTNTVLFSEGQNNSVKTFSVGYDGVNSSYRNEFEYARQIAELVGAQHFEKQLTPDDLIAFLPDMVKLQDEPIADPVCFPLHFVSKLARESGVIVCQVGEGSDELFCGYPHWKSMLLLQRLNAWPVPRSAKQAGLKFLDRIGFGESFPYEWLRRGVLEQPIFWGGAEAFTDAHKNRLLDRNFRRTIDVDTSWDALAPIRSRFDAAAWDKSSLNWMTYLDLRLRLPELLLMRVDKMSMGASLEAREPFLDHKLVELVMSIPTKIKMGDGALKYLLKRTVRGLIPDNIIDRKKQGFGVPMNEWFRGLLGKRMRAELEFFCRETGYLNIGAVQQVIEKGHADQAWYLFNLALWWRVFIARL